MTYGTDPGSGGNPSYGTPSEPSRPRGRVVGWTVGSLVVLAGILFGVYSCGNGGPGTTPPTPTPVVYPPTTSTMPTTPTVPTTPYSAVVPPTVVTDGPPTYVPPDVTTTRPPVTTTTTASPPTRVDAGSGGGADGGRQGTVGLVVAGLLLAGVGLTVLLRARRRSS